MKNSTRHANLACIIIVAGLLISLFYKHPFNGWVRTCFLILGFSFFQKGYRFFQLEGGQNESDDVQKSGPSLLPILLAVLFILAIWFIDTH